MHRVSARVGECTQLSILDITKEFFGFVNVSVCKSKRLLPTVVERHKPRIQGCRSRNTQKVVPKVEQNCEPDLSFVYTSKQSVTPSFKQNNYAISSPITLPRMWRTWQSCADRYESRSRHSGQPFRLHLGTDINKKLNSIPRVQAIVMKVAPWKGKRRRFIIRPRSILARRSLRSLAPNS